ncbi:MAG: hypothetical protein N2749_03865 [Clostridia bacterium]|nr:hypothetical protein [Clostridia bacterium]
MKKRGVTLIIVMVAVVIMFIIITSASVIGSGSIKTANFQNYQSKLSRASNAINEYYLKNNKLPVTGEEVSVDTLSSDFINQIVDNNDSKNKLFVVDASLLQDSTIKFGTRNYK